MLAPIRSGIEIETFDADEKSIKSWRFRLGTLGEFENEGNWKIVHDLSILRIIYCYTVMFEWYKLLIAVKVLIRDS